MISGVLTKSNKSQKFALKAQDQDKQLRENK